MPDNCDSNIISSKFIRLLHERLQILLFYLLGEVGDLVCIQVSVEIAHRFRARRTLVLQSGVGAPLNSLGSHCATLPELDILAGLIVVRITDHLSHGHVHEVPGLKHHPLFHTALVSFKGRVSLSILIHVRSRVHQLVASRGKPRVRGGVNQVIVNHVVVVGRACRVWHDQMLVVIHVERVHWQMGALVLDVTSQARAQVQWVHQGLGQARHREAVESSHFLTQSGVLVSQIRTGVI